MSMILPDILRSLVTNVMLVLLLYTLAEPRAGKMIRYFSLAVIVLTDFSVNVYFYCQRDYTSLAKFDILYFFLVGLVIKPLFRDRIMPWLFNCITVWNVYVVITILSYYLSDFLPFSDYANTFLRVLLFGGSMLQFRSKLRPLYRQAIERWNIYLLVSVGIFLNLIWAFISADNIETALQSRTVSLLLLIGLSIVAYTAIFWSLHKNQEETLLREENFKISADRELMRQRLMLMDDAVKRMSIARHDQRHFNRTLTTLLEQGQVSEASALLKQQLKNLPQKPRIYCENIPVNAAVSYYAEQAERMEITGKIRLIIPEKINVDELSLAMAVSNLMENAIQACSLLPEEKREFTLTAMDTGQLLLEISNPCPIPVKFDPLGLPVSETEGHGEGTKSVAAFVKHYGGELEYKSENGVFRVRMMV